MSEDIRTALKAIQWERVKGELRAFAALAGSYSGISEMSEKWTKIDNELERFIKSFENKGLHE